MSAPDQTSNEHSGADTEDRPYMFYFLREVKEMFCPSCGSEERQVSQFCRACGVDLRAVRVTLEKPDAITASALNALLFTVPKQYVPDHSLDTRQRDLLDEAPDRVIPLKGELATAEPLSPPPSVTEQTTHHLTDSPARARESG